MQFSSLRFAVALNSVELESVGTSAFGIGMQEAAISPWWRVSGASTLPQGLALVWMSMSILLAVTV